MLDKLVLNGLSLSCLCLGHASLEEALLSSSLDLVQFLHGLDCLYHECSVVADWLIAALLELEHWVACHLLAMCSSGGLGPSHLSWVFLGLEQSVALGCAEPEHLGVVSHECYTVTGVDVGRAEVTLVYPHFICSLCIIYNITLRDFNINLYNKYFLILYCNAMYYSKLKVFFQKYNVYFF